MKIERSFKGLWDFYTKHYLKNIRDNWQYLTLFQKIWWPVKLPLLWIWIFVSHTPWMIYKFFKP